MSLQKKTEKNWAERKKQERRKKKRTDVNWRLV